MRFYIYDYPDSFSDSPPIPQAVLVCARKIGPKIKGYQPINRTWAVEVNTLEELLKLVAANEDEMRLQPPGEGGMDENGLPAWSLQRYSRWR